MKPTMDQHAHPRPSYLGEGIGERQWEAPKSIDDLRTNLSEKFSLLAHPDSSTTQMSAEESKQNMHVFLRVRPFTAPEIENHEEQDCVGIPDACSVLVKPPCNSQASRLSEKGGSVAQKFTFTHVFGPETSQSQFFEGTMRKQVIDFMKGQNRLIFTYGVTNAGKTFTFQGTKDEAGILPRSMEMLFNTIEGKVYSKMDIKPHRCRDYIRLTKEQMKTEAAAKASVLRHSKETDLQYSIWCNNSKTSVNTTGTDEGLSNASRVTSELEEQLKESEEFSLDVDASIKFSVWVSFCEIYNECIFDLLDPVLGDKFYKRKTLKLAQDIKGFSFVKDVQWIQVSDAKEACRILALGKKFQSIAFTKLNSSSSRSHSIFTVRLLKIEDADVPRVVKVSELALCDLAGSERCAKTQNEGERLKESGNINTSLLILGKCINALKNSQQSKIQQHVPFRESKLTHYLQSFFSGKGKVCMIVNVSQSASAYDETLNVLKFSAVAQKVLILDTSQTADISQQKSAREVSFIINNADNKMWLSRRRATVQWDTDLESVFDGGEEVEEDDGECSEDEECLDCTNLEEQDYEDCEEEEIIIKKEAYEKLLELVEDLKTKLVNEKKDKLLMELKIREEVAREFTQHFMERENDFSERLQKEKELMEERCDERMEIFQELVRKCSNEEKDVEEDANQPSTTTDNTPQVEDPNLPLQGLFSSMETDLATIKQQAVEARHHISAISDEPATITELKSKVQELTSELAKMQAELITKSADLNNQIEKCAKTCLQLEETEKKLATQRQQIDQFVDMIQEKDSAIEKLKDLITLWEAKCDDYEKTISSFREEMAKLGTSDDGSSSRKRPPDDQHYPENQPPSKKELVETIDGNMELDKKKKETKEGIEILQELKQVSTEKEQYRVQVLNLNRTVVELNEKLASRDQDVTDLESRNVTVASELQAQKVLTSALEGKVEALKQEIDHNKVNTASRLAQLKTLHSKLEDFDKNDIKPDFEVESLNLSDAERTSQRNLTSGGNESIMAKIASGRESAFYSAIEGLWKKCQEVLRESAKKNMQNEILEKELDDLKNKMAELQNAKDSLQVQLCEATSRDSILQGKEHLIVQLREQLSEATDSLDRYKKQELDYKNELSLNSQQIKDLGLLVDSYKEKYEKLNSLEEESKEKAAAFQTLEKSLAGFREEHAGCEKSHQKLTAEKVGLEQRIKQMQEELAAAHNAKNEGEKQVAEATKEIELLKKDLSQQASQLKTTQLDLQRKEEEYTELKEKLADAKKQMQQVEREISAMREEKKTLTNKVNEYEKLKKQMSSELEMKQRTIQQLGKELRDNEKTGDAAQLYQKACQDVKAKEKIIEGMKLTLIEQEQTQEEQEQALEAKTEEAEKLAKELELWKQKYSELGKISSIDILTKISTETNNNLETSSTEQIKLQNQLKELEEKYSNGRKKWLEEKLTLIGQAKESENHRNKEMRKFAEDRERYIKQQTEVENLSAQLAEKEKTLENWRKERDELLSALEIQLKTLVSSNAEKQREIETLKNATNGHNKEDSSALDEVRRQLAASEAKVRELQDKLTKVENKQPSSVSVAPVEMAEKIQTQTTEKLESANLLGTNCRETNSSSNSDVSLSDNQSQDGSDTVLDSSMLSTQNGQASRFPKPQMEIRFSPVKPNKMEVKHLGNDSTTTVRIKNTRKRKSNEMEQEIIKSENRKNTRSNTVASPAINNTESKKFTLRKQPSTSSTLSSKKKDSTLQKLGEFLQKSPSIFQTNAKKLLLGTIGPQKTTDVMAGRNQEESKPKKPKRKLFSEISAPLDIPAHAIIIDTNEKESDHLIMKRRLRTRTAK
ncbi:kinesin-like protein KIF20B isoform X2 [Hyperolius riggenbachi]|uniref:kinesin-like protein KIF20B isoform X2 n=1 Tax=Hyperolius riggenbachi TaxID=752182 RepID=UPI0035A3A9A7